MLLSSNFPVRLSATQINRKNTNLSSFPSLRTSAAFDWPIGSYIIENRLTGPKFKLISPVQVHSAKSEWPAIIVTVTVLHRIHSRSHIGSHSSVPPVLTLLVNSSPSWFDPIQCGRCNCSRCRAEHDSIEKSAFLLWRNTDDQCNQPVHLFSNTMFRWRIVRKITLIATCGNQALKHSRVHTVFCEQKI